MGCMYYEFKSSGWFGGDYWCKKTDTRVDDNHYRRYCRDYNYDECPTYKHQESTGCFITTVSCQVLGMDDQNPVMNNLRNFRKDILRKDEKYYFILKEYDVIGPKIVECLENDKNKEEMALLFYYNTILPVNELINQKNYDGAVSLYHMMTKALVEYYGLTEEYQAIKERDYDYEGFDPNLAGHGIKKVRTIN